jgi:restriction system protein
MRVRYLVAVSFKSIFLNCYSHRCCFLGEIAASFVPDMRKKENKNKHPYTGLPQKTSAKKPSKQTSAKKQTASATSASSSEQTRKYGVRSDDVILQ